MKSTFQKPDATYPHGSFREQPEMKKKVRKSFCDRLAEKLEQSELFEIVEQGSFSDDSARWISVKIGKNSMTFQFDMKGEKMGRIGVWQDVVKVVEAEPYIIFNTKT